MSTKYPQGLINGTPPYTTGNFSGVWTLEQLAQKYYFFGDGVSNSLRFRSSASAYLSRTPAAAGNQKTWTWSAWVKRGTLSTGNARLLWGGSSTTDGFALTWTATDTLYVWNYAASTTTLALTSSAVFRDPSSWYHIVLSVDTTQATDVNRVRLYVNGVQYTFGTTTWCAQNTSLLFNAANQNTIGYSPPYGGYFDGYLAEVNFIDGLALNPSSFGVVAPATGVWSPKRYSGNYGLNGFYLPFSNGTSTTTLGYDSSGNGNNWTTNNISLTAGSTYDWMLDSPTPYQGSSYGVGNYCTWNPLRPNAAMSYSNGNLSATSNGGSGRSSYGTFGMASSKWYFELTGGDNTCGLSTVDDAVYAYYQAAGSYNINGSITSGKSTYTTTDVIGCAYDADTNTIEWFKNNVSQGTISFSAASGKPVVPIFSGTISVSRTCVINAGQRPFTYSPPSGYKSLCTYNLSGPSINNGASYMAATLWTGTGATQTLSNAVNGVSFAPDLVWAKLRSGADNHRLADTVRGANKLLMSNLTDAESSLATVITGFTSSGFTVGTDGSVNTSGATYVGWQWKAGGTAVTNTAGSITSSVSANTTSGFSVVTYTGATSGTVGHGLGVAPSMIICKSRSGATDWPVYHVSLGKDNVMVLNSTGAVQNVANYWGSSTPGASVFGLWSSSGGNNNGSMVAYCFAAIPGYSAFGSYTGNGSTDGPFVYCGFRPRFVLIKWSSGVEYWQITDSSRSPDNQVSLQLAPDQSLAESSLGTPQIDYLSNGFKLRGSSNRNNASGGTYIYACFAENPFKYSLAR